MRIGGFKMDCKSFFIQFDGKKFKKNGYWCVYKKWHPRAFGRWEIYLHILVAEQKLGRHLLDNEVVHHIDGNRLNNEPDNLLVCTRSEHAKIHWPKVSISEDVGVDGTRFANIRKPEEVMICNGYRYIFKPESPMSGIKGYVPEHRLVYAAYLGRDLTDWELVSHKNSDRLDNRIENLVMYTRKKGPRLHSIERYVRKSKTGRKVQKSGYVMIWNPTHPMANGGGYVLEHRAVMAEHLGRMLERYEHVHHINGNRQDNRIENLQLFTRWTHPSRHVRNF
jgi:hypothetical protein